MRSVPQSRERALARLLGVSALLFLGGKALAEPRPRAPEESLAEVDYLLRSGVPASAIRAFVEAEELRFVLTARDLVALKEAGADEGLLLFLLERTRRAGPPVELEGATVIYEAKGIRAFRKKDSSGRELLVVTNLDENGLRLDVPPDLPDPSSHEPAPDEPAGEVIGERPTPERRKPEQISDPFPPVTPPAPPPSPPARRGTVYVGPFYQFVPSNLPGPGSPWSPVFQVLPTPWGWPLVSVYPFYGLTALYPCAGLAPYGIHARHGFSGGISSFHAWAR